MDEEIIISECSTSVIQKYHNYIKFKITINLQVTKQVRAVNLQVNIFQFNCLFKDCKLDNHTGPGYMVN